MDGAQAVSAGTGPASSTGSPMTFMMRPSVPLPTGTMMGAPVSRHGLAAGQALGRVHRDAAHRVDSPSCWATSSTRRCAVVVGLERVQDLGQVAVELHVDDGADHLRDPAGRVGADGGRQGQGG